MEELHSQGKTIEDIAECLKQVAIHPKIIAAIKSAHDLGYFPLSSSSHVSISIASVSLSQIKS